MRARERVEWRMRDRGEENESEKEGGVKNESERGWSGE